MFPAGQHPLYPYTKEERQEILAEIGFTEKQMQRDTESITDWFYKQPHLSAAGIYPHIIQMYLISSKGSVEKVKQKIDNYYRHRRNASEFFSDRINLLNNPKRTIWKTHLMAPMPKLYKGHRISVIKITDRDNFKMEDILLNTFMAADIRFLNDFVYADIWVIDIKELKLSDIFKLNLVMFAKGCLIFHEGIALRIANLHILNCSNATFAQNIMNFLKRFLSKKLIDRIQFHETIEDLYTQLPKEYLPKDYGGELPTLIEFRDKYETFMTSDKTKQFLIDACKLASDEDKRPKSTYSEDYLQGSFKKIEID